MRIISGKPGLRSIRLYRTRGAALHQCGSRLFGDWGRRCGFNEDPHRGGRDALAFYHERKDEQRNVGLGPEHDWSSHAADSFGLMAICYEPPSSTAAFNRPINYPQYGIA
jgi:hypothetical protein